MQNGATIKSEVYCETKLLRIIQKKMHGMLTSGVDFLHDNACPHTATHSRPLVENFNWELFDHPPYSPDFAPSDYHLFTGCDHSASAIMSWWKVSKRGWAHRWQTSLTQAHKNLFLDTTSASVPAVTTLRSSLSM
jgi:hypothetical protein